jgi:hypothetical protein
MHVQPNTSRASVQLLASMFQYDHALPACACICVCACSSKHRPDSRPTWKNSPAPSYRSASYPKHRPSRKSTQPSPIKKRQAKGDPPLIQNKQEGKLNSDYDAPCLPINTSRESLSAVPEVTLRISCQRCATRSHRRYRNDQSCLVQNKKERVMMCLRRASNSSSVQSFIRAVLEYGSFELLIAIRADA